MEGNTFIASVRGSDRGVNCCSILRIPIRGKRERGKKLPNAEKENSTNDGAERKKMRQDVLLLAS